MISNGFHLYRVSLIAKGLYLDYDYIPAKSHTGTYVHFMIREYFGVLKEYAKILFNK